MHLVTLDSNNCAKHTTEEMSRYPKNCDHQKYEQNIIVDGFKAQG